MSKAMKRPRSNFKDEALRRAFMVFYAMSYGATLTPKMAKNMADLCGIALPMRHRFTHEELEALATGTNLSEMIQ